MENLNKRIEVDFAQFTSKGKIHLAFSEAGAFCLHHPNIIYCNTNDTFYEYIDGVYNRLAKSQMIKMINECDNIPDSKSYSRRFKLDIIDNIKDVNQHKIEEFNQDNLINFKNCYLNISTMEKSNHSPEYISTIQLPFDFDENAQCPLWEKTIDEILQGAKDHINTLQEYFGYCFTKETKYEKALFMIGDGQNGKSTVIEGLNFCLGEDNVSALSMRNISDPRYVGALSEKYANIMTEIPKNVHSYEEDFKLIVSGEPMTVNEKYKPVHKIRPYCKMIFACNKMPHIGDTSSAVYRRLLILPFDREFKEEEQVKCQPCPYCFARLILQS